MLQAWILIPVLLLAINKPVYFTFLGLRSRTLSNTLEIIGLVKPVSHVKSVLQIQNLLKRHCAIFDIVCDCGTLGHFSKYLINALK